MYGLIYSITNTLTGKLYVGQTTQRPARRWSSHKRESRKPSPSWALHRAMAKYGAENFVFCVIEHCPDRALLDAREIYWVRALGTMQPRGYNMTEGGGGIAGFKMPEEACRRLGDRMRGRAVSPETGRKISAAKKGIAQSAELIAKRAEAQRGKRHSAERRAKIGAAHKGRVLTPEHIAKRSASRRGKPLPASARAAISRSVIADGVTYPSVSAAATSLGVTITAIQYRIRTGVRGYASVHPVRRRRKRTPTQIEKMRGINAKAIVAEGREYPSLTTAAAALGISRQVVRARIDKGHSGYSQNAV